MQIRTFVRRHSRYEFGFVSHALSAAVKKLLREFDIIISQLEVLLKEDRLSIQKIVLFLQPSIGIFRVLSQMCSRIQDHVGGELLDILHTMTLEQGDLRSKSLLSTLLNKAASPFLEMLDKWLFK